MSCLSIPRVTLVSIFTWQNLLLNVYVAHNISTDFGICPIPFFSLFRYFVLERSWTSLKNLYIHSLRCFNSGKLVLFFWFSLHVMWGLCIWWRLSAVMVKPFVPILLDELFWAIKHFWLQGLVQRFMSQSSRKGDYLAILKAIFLSRHTLIASLVNRKRILFGFPICMCLLLVTRVFTWPVIRFLSYSTV